MKKIVAIITATVLVVILVPRIVVVTEGVWDFLHTNKLCYGRDPTPPDEYANQIPFPLYKVTPYSVVTDRGFMFPGDEYEVTGEGDWIGMVTLLWAGKDGAYFLVDFDIDDPINDYSRSTCKWYTPIGDYK